MAPNASNIQPTDDADVLSLLPSDVLVSILEKLTLRDAIRAGALSRRWRQLSGQLPRLALDFVDFMPGPGKYHDEDDEEELDTPASSSDDALSAAGDRMLEVATAVLASRAAGQQQLPVCAMSFYLRHNYMSLGRLLNDAVAGGKVRAVELTISTTCKVMSGGPKAIDRALLGYGRRFRAFFGGCPAAFGGLTRLTIKTMALGEPELNDVLAACTRLEFLSLEEFVAGRPWLWRVRHARLADLRITFGRFREVHLVWLPRLERVAYRYSGLLHSRQPLSFGHVPRLTTLVMSDHFLTGSRTVKLSHILANTAVQELRLNFGGEDIWVQPEPPKRLTDTFRNLNYLKVCNIHEKCGLSWTMFLIHAAPLLKELYIKLWDHECNRQRLPAVKNEPWDVVTDFKHYSLTRIVIKGFYEDTLVTYLRHLVQVAVNLEVIRIYENATCEDCDAERTGFPRMDEDRERLIKRITDGGSSHNKIHMVSY
ncbi:hypothetical protein EJB05_10224, partial [Eragrostis curvula]